MHGARVHLEELTAPQPVKHFRNSWSPKVHHRVHNSRPAPTMTHVSPVHAVPSTGVQIHINITLHTKPKSSQWCLSFGSTDHNPVYSSVLRNTRNMSIVSHLSRFHQRVLPTWGPVQARMQLLPTAILKLQTYMRPSTLIYIIYTHIKRVRVSQGTEYASIRKLIS